MIRDLLIRDLLTKAHSIEDHLTMGMIETCMIEGMTGDHMIEEGPTIMSIGDPTVEGHMIGDIMIRGPLIRDPLIVAMNVKGTIMIYTRIALTIRGVTQTQIPCIITVDRLWPIGECMAFY